MNRRSRLAAVIAAAGVATALASPAAAVTITIDHQTLEFADAFVGDIGSRVGPVTDVTLTETFFGDPVLVYSHSDFVAVTCGDGSDGLVGTSREGQAEHPAFAFDPQKVAYARASATIEVTDLDVDTCAGSAVATGSATISVSLDLTGSGPIVRDSTIFKSGLPGLFLQRWPEQLRFRNAAGSITVDGVSTAIPAANGFIGYSHGVNHVIEH
jgi:hypothetical protein